MFVRVYNYNTTEMVKAFEAHTDYIRCHAPSKLLEPKTLNPKPLDTKP